MSVSLIGSRCESTARHAAHLSFKRLRLSPTQYTERLVCRVPRNGRGDGEIDGKRRFGSCSGRVSATRRPQAVNAVRSVPDPYTPSTPPTRAFSSSAPSRHDAPPTSSVSPSEVSHFSRLASTWWDPHGPSRLLHLMNPLRHDFIRTCLSSTTTSPSPPKPNSLSYLDIGCGGGIFSSSAALLPSTSHVTAIDPTPACIAAAKAHARTDPSLSPPPTGKLTYLNTSIESLPPDQPPVDILTLFEVLEHITHPSTFLTTALPHLKPNGWLIGSTIARSPVSYLTTKLIAEAPLIGVVPRGTHDWNQYINPAELEEFFATKAPGRWGPFITQGVVYVPGLGWKVVQGSEGWGNYFFGVQKLE